MSFVDMEKATFAATSGVGSEPWGMPLVSLSSSLGNAGARFLSRWKQACSIALLSVFGALQSLSASAGEQCEPRWFVSALALETPPNVKVPGVMDPDFMAIYIGRVGETNAPRRVTDLGWRAAPVWAPSGDRVAYMHVKPEVSSRIFMTDRQGRRHVEVHGPYDVEGQTLSWSSDGRSIAFHGASQAVSVVHVDDRIVVPVSKKRGEAVSWSPCGRYVAFMMRTGVDWNDSDGWVLVIHDLKEQRDVQIGKRSDSRGLVYPFYWTPDGKRVIFVRFAVDQQRVRSRKEWWAVEPEGSDLRPLKEDENPVVIDQRYYPWRRPLIDKE